MKDFYIKKEIVIVFFFFDNNMDYNILRGYSFFYVWCLLVFVRMFEILGFFFMSRIIGGWDLVS